MKLDRHEAFVLELLHKKFNMPIGKIKSLIDLKRLSIMYRFDKPIIRVFLHSSDDSFYGEAVCQERDNKQYTERVGRMIALAKAFLDYYNTHYPYDKVKVTGNELEQLVRNYKAKKYNEEEQNGC